MPRIARVLIPGVPVHVTQRGNYRQNIFDEDDDKEYYIKSFFEFRKKHNVKVYAWCLMDNHVHFILEPTDKAGLGKMFKSLNTRYSLYFNRKLKRKGRLFDDRFFSCLLDEYHFYEAVRYVELNPYKAKIENEIGKYFWNSSQEHLKLRQQFYLNKHPEYFVVDNWLNYLKEGITEGEFSEKIMSHTLSGFPLGNDSFVRKVSIELEKDLTMKSRGRPFKK
tara:strand:+ start:455 stop:1117 length:663 start_codon:yes stop_codon:yes gene_type:complete